MPGHDARTTSLTADLPQRASVVVVGGGVMGVSTAFHLAEAGVRDVLRAENLGSLLVELRERGA